MVKVCKNSARLPLPVILPGYAIQPLLLLFELLVCFFGRNFRQVSPELSKTTSLGMRAVLKPKALQPLGFAGSQVT